jgi:hypothetical protein
LHDGTQACTTGGTPSPAPDGRIIKIMCKAAATGAEEHASPPTKRPPEGGVPEGSENETCSACSAPAAKRCSRCQHARYCSRECQTTSWATHKFICSAYLVVKTSVAGDGRGCFARRAFKVGEEINREAPLMWWEAVRNDGDAEAANARFKQVRLARGERASQRRVSPLRCSNPPPPSTLRYLASASSSTLALPRSRPRPSRWSWGCATAQTVRRPDKMASLSWVSFAATAIHSASPAEGPVHRAQRSSRSHASSSTHASPTPACCGARTGRAADSSRSP